MQNLQSTKAVKVFKTGINILVRRVWVCKILQNIRLKAAWASERPSESLGVKRLTNVFLKFSIGRKQQRMWEKIVELFLIELCQF